MALVCSQIRRAGADSATCGTFVETLRELDPLELDPLELDVARGYLAIGLPLGPAGLTINRFVARRYVATRRRHAERGQGGLRSVRRLLG